MVLDVHLSTMQIDYHTTISPNAFTWMMTQPQKSSISLYISEGSQHFTINFITQHLPVLEELVKQLKQIKQQEVLKLRQQLDEQLCELENLSDEEISNSQSQENIASSYSSEF
jgi:hypothetical protein